MFSFEPRYMIAIALTSLLCMLQYQTWTGRASVQAVAAMQKNLVQLQADNQQRKDANARLRSEIRDLKEGLATVEERARYELGMVKPDEIFVQITD